MSFESSLIWVERDFLCFGEKPGRWRSLEEDLTYLRSRQVGAVVSLLEIEPALEIYERNGFVTHHIPIQDFHAPTQTQFQECMHILADFHRRRIAVHIHCNAGVGRSGTMAAAWLIYSGKRTLEAVESIRRLKVGTVETDDQYSALLEYEARLRLSNNPKQGF